MQPGKQDQPSERPLRDLPVRGRDDHRPGQVLRFGETGKKLREFVRYQLTVGKSFDRTILEEEGYTDEEIDREYERFKARYGYVELNPRNGLILKLHSLYSLEIVRGSRLGDVLLREFRDEIRSQGGIREVVARLVIVAEEVRKFETEKRDRDQREADARQPRRPRYQG